MVTMMKERLCRWSRVYVDHQSKILMHIKEASSVLQCFFLHHFIDRGGVRRADEASVRSHAYQPGTDCYGRALAPKTAGTLLPFHPLPLT